eukprot:SAG31_NODE_13707_length_852_cov_0.984064_1_plen_83_part_00
MLAASSVRYPLDTPGDGLRMIGKEAILRAVHAKFDKIDKDGDHNVDHNEKTKHFEKVANSERKRGSLVEFEPSFEAADWCAP